MTRVRLPAPAPAPLFCSDRTLTRCAEPCCWRQPMPRVESLRLPLRSLRARRAFVARSLRSRRRIARASVARLLLAGHAHPLTHLQTMEEPFQHADWSARAVPLRALESKPESRWKRATQVRSKPPVGDI